MRLAIDTSTYHAGAGCLAGANGDAADLLDVLKNALSGSDGMAGDDDTAVAFARAYDDAAAAAFDSLGDLMTASATLGKLLARSELNHLLAEQANHHDLSGTTVAPDPDDPGGRLDWRYPLTCARPPSSLGSGGDAMPGWASWVLDRVHDFVWPDADTGRLHDAADTWHAAAGRAWSVLDGLCAAERHLEGLRSPEIPLVHQHLDALILATRDLSAQLRGLGDACSTYADAVDAQRAAVLDLVHDLLRDTAICEAAGAVLDFFIGPEATGGATALALARIAEKAPAILRCLDAIRDVGDACADGLRTARSAMEAVRARMTLILDLRLSARAAVDVGKLNRLEFEGWLERNELPDDVHIIERHVGRTDGELMARFSEAHPPPFSSTFADEGTAERCIRDALRANKEQIAEWLKKAPANGTKGFRTSAGPGVGRVLGPDGLVHPVAGVKIVIRRAPGAPSGIRIISAFPTP